MNAPLEDTKHTMWRGRAARDGVTLEIAMTVYDGDTAVVLSISASTARSCRAGTPTLRWRASVAAISISGIAPIRLGWALRDSHELALARALMRLLQVIEAGATHASGLIEGYVCGFVRSVRRWRARSRANQRRTTGLAPRSRSA